MCPRFLHTEFRRIYGVVFRILLYGEASVYLLIVGATYLFNANNCCSFIISMACTNYWSNHKQTNCNYNAKAQRQNFYYTLSG